MDYTLDKINSIINGRLIGAGNTSITGVASVENAGQGDITFIKDDSLVDKLLASETTAAVIHREIDGFQKPAIIVDNPFHSFIKFLETIAAERNAQPCGIHPSACVSKTATLGANISIGANTVIDDGTQIGDNATIRPNVFIGRDCVIGDNAFIHPNVVIYEQTTIGDRATIFPGTVIGADGFGYLQKDGKHVKIPQVGVVEIGNDVEIGANVTIDRAALDKTVIGNGVKIDNHSHVAHNAIIGDNTILVAYAKIAGGAVIGKNVLIAEDVGINDHAVIGDNCIVGGGSNVYKSLPPGSVVWGSPARPLNEEKKIQSIIKRLPEMRQKIKDLEKKAQAGNQLSVIGNKHIP